jgi:hypothetical protein
MVEVFKRYKETDTCLTYNSLKYVLGSISFGFVEENQIILMKYEPNRACAITGTVSDQNEEYPRGIVLSPVQYGLIVPEKQVYHEVLRETGRGA